MIRLIFAPKNLLNVNDAEGEMLIKYINNKYPQDRMSKIIIPIEDYLGDDSSLGYNHIQNELYKIDLDYLDKHIPEDILKTMMKKNPNSIEFKSSEIDLIPRFGAFSILAASLYDRGTGIENNLRDFLEVIDTDEESENILNEMFKELNFEFSKYGTEIINKNNGERYDAEITLNYMFSIDNGKLIKSEHNINVFKNMDYILSYITKKCIY